MTTKQKLVSILFVLVLLALCMQMRDGLDDPVTAPSPREAPVTAARAAYEHEHLRPFVGDRLELVVASRVRPWSVRAIELTAAPGEQRAVHAHRLATYDPTRPGPPPNPFVPPQLHLGEADTRAGLDEP